MRYNICMPTASAPQQNNSTITYTDDQLRNMQHNVASNLQNAGVQIDYQSVKPVHVPDERPKNIIDQTQTNTENSVPGSFNSTPETAFSPLKALSEHLDYADQIVTGRTHVIDEAQRFSKHKTEKENKKMAFDNNPDKQPRGPVKKFVDWLHDE